eukprot:8643775-Lingulodinium_polyedra.AAC.1
MLAVAAGRADASAVAAVARQPACNGDPRDAYRATKSNAQRGRVYALVSRRRISFSALEDPVSIWRPAL